MSGLALALATHRWPPAARFAALWGFVEPLVDASGHARLHHGRFLLEKWPKRQRISGASRSFGLPPIATSHLTLNWPPPPPGEEKTLPFSHMLLMFRMSVTTGRSTAPERGDRDSLFSLCGDNAADLRGRRKRGKGEGSDGGGWATLGNLTV